MFGRLTGTARHLTDPAHKIYYATMEEGLYEVDVKTLEVKCHIRDGNGGAPEAGLISELPGYHGKGLYSSQGRLVYANNGERGPKVSTDPTVTSGALAQWFGEGDWQLVRRNQFTEVTGPGGIHGSSNPDADPIWAMGWDARSVILALLENQQWHYFRLPKASHSYDGAHGWNTEWPRIREIGETDLLATMHGTFWRFPARFSLSNSAGIAPRSNYLKVIGDFCRWNDQIVLGCDDSAKSEFLNTRSFKARHASPGQSNSNLWFVKPKLLDQLGPAIGRGSVWLHDELDAKQTSNPYLFAGYDYRQLHLSHNSDETITFTLEVDRKGSNEWTLLREIAVDPGEAAAYLFPDQETGAWIRLVTGQAASGVTANFQYRNRDRRGIDNDSQFAGIATPNKSARTYGLMRSLAQDKLGIVAAGDSSGDKSGYYEMNQQMELVPVDDPTAAKELVAAVRQPSGTITVDDASVLVVEDRKRYRLPKNQIYAETESVESRAAKTLQDYLGESLTKGATVTVSSTHSQYAAEHAVDGSLTDDSRWIGKNEGQTWIELDLGQPKTFRSVWVVSGWQHDQQYVAENFDVQVKEGDAWKPIPGGAIRGNSRIETEIVLDRSITSQHVRLVSDTNNYFRIYEVALFDRELGVANDPASFGIARVCREVATERDLLNIHGTFYELPARNAQGLAKIRPVATHNLAIHDFCSHNGLLLFTGIDGETRSQNIFRSADGKAAVWAGVVDDLWKLGKPRGSGGPWNKTSVAANEPSDPYLMTAYDQKSVQVSSSREATIHLEVDIDGTGLWLPYKSFSLQAGESINHAFPAGFSAYWVRAISDTKTIATVTFTYQ
jgi:hypothetical protein